MYMAHPYFTDDCSITMQPVMLRKTAQKQEKNFLQAMGSAKLPFLMTEKGGGFFPVLCMVSCLHCNLCGGTGGTECPLYH